MANGSDRQGPEDPPAFRPEDGTLGEGSPPTRPLPPEQPSPVGTLLGGRYRMEKPLGSGGFGAVHLAKDETLGRRVAIKTLHGHVDRERFAREARALARLQHPNVVAVHDFGTAEGRDYLVLEHVDGPTLADLLEHGALPWREAVSLAADIAAALAHAADHRVLHRDVKPSNVLLSQGRHAKVVDFGIAQIEDEATLTEAGAVVGTLAYMAPESLDRGLHDERSEVWSLGAVLHELLSGERPFQASSHEQLVSTILQAEPRPMPTERELPASLAELVEHCLAKAPEDRPSSVHALERSLRELLPAESTESESELVPPRLQVSAAVAPPPGEKRRVALLWIEERHLDELVERHGEAEAQRLRRGLLQPLLNVIEDHEGLVSGIEDDGLLVVFGLPRVRESDVARALSAAEEIVALPQPANSGGVPVRCALALGLGAVEGERGQRPRPRAAGRRQLRALLADAPATSIQSTPTFDEARRGLKSTDSKRRGALGRPAASGPMVGRSAELSLLGDAARNAFAGRGLVATIQADAGLGKSRLLAALLDDLAGQGSPPVVIAAEAPDVANSAPGELARRLGDRLVREEAVAAALDGLETRRLTQLLGSDTALSPQERENAQRVAWAKALRALARTGPIVIAVEDLHAADAASLRLLERIAEIGSHLPVFLVATHRPGPSPSWIGRAYHRPIVLASLDQAALGELLAAELPDVSDEKSKQLLELADGNPFYLLELARSRRDHDSAELKLPESVGAVLAEQLDRLPRAHRELLQAGAVLGRDFPLAAAAAIAELDSEDARERTGRLVSEGQLFDCYAWEEEGCSFPHPLSREAAIDSISAVALRELHGRAATLVESEGSEALPPTPERLAYHWSRSQEEERALPYLDRAADRARAAGNLSDAVALARRAAEIAEDCDDGAKRETSRLRLAEVLAWAGETRESRTIAETLAAEAAADGDDARELAALRCLALGLGFAGHAAEELAMLDRAGKLAETAGVTRLVAELQARRCEALYSLGRTREAEQELGVLERMDIDDVEVRLDQHKLSALIAYRGGDLLRAEAEARAGLELALGNDQGSRAVRFLSQAATVVAARGPISEAQLAADECLKEAQRVGLPGTVSYALALLASLLLAEGKLVEAEARSRESVILAGDLGMDGRRIVALHVLIDVLLEQDRLVDVIDTIAEAAALTTRLESAVWARELLVKRSLLAFAKEQVQDAVDLAEELLRDAREASDAERIAAALSLLARGRTGEAAVLAATEAVDSAREGGNAATLVSTLIASCRAWCDAGDLNSARLAGEEGLTVAKQNELALQESSLRFELALCRDPPVPEEALSCLRTLEGRGLEALARQAAARFTGTGA